MSVLCRPMHNFTQQLAQQNLTRAQVYYYSVKQDLHFHLTVDRTANKAHPLELQNFLNMSVDMKQ